MGKLDALRAGWCLILRTTRAPPECTATATNEGLADVQGRSLLGVTTKGKFLSQIHAALQTELFKSEDEQFKKDH